ncbi:hypothetical protein CDL15_Pgr017835 [Punica granatum]|uniref:Glyoxylate/hydroxypyruvate reductase HPR3-like n=1 Tax=Punica granatum TaxID=22663 RepID=A0A218WIT9_PUNGR|nr:hypothetical protein CDL15_Pgr017835 [Punica granatum]
MSESPEKSERFSPGFMPPEERDKESWLAEEEGGAGDESVDGTRTAPHDKPVVLLHRLQSFNLPFKGRLSDHYTILDPWSSPDLPDSFLACHGPSVRALLCVGPSPLPSSTLRLLPCLELVVGHIDLPECRRRGISVTNAGPAFSEDVADYAVGLLLDVLRRVSAGDRHVRSRQWAKEGAFPLGSKLGGKRVGIVGLGNIGSQVAKRLTAFGCEIAYISRKEKPSAPFPYYSTILDLAANSDILVLCCALTDDTHHIINRDVMTVLGKHGVIINVGRGALIDEKELVQFLVGGDLHGAGLDVFEDEPNVPKELFDLDNVVLSPHVAATTPESFQMLEDLVVSNLKAFFTNKPLSALV